MVDMVYSGRRRKPPSRTQRLLGRAIPMGLTLVTGIGVVTHLSLSGPSAGSGSHTTAANPSTEPVLHAFSGGSPAAYSTPETRATLRQKVDDYLDDREGHAAVGDLDLDTGDEFCVHCHQHFVTASIVKVDILEALLYRAEQAHTHLTSSQRELARRMIEESDNDAASDLYDQDDGSTGITAANHHLGLRETVVGADGYWGLTRTTVSDQLQLLDNLVDHHSALGKADRRFVRYLMSHVISEQRWGVPTAATGHERALVKNGWLPYGDGWKVNSDGVLLGGGIDEIAVSALSSDDPSEDYGIATVQRLARMVAGRVQRASAN